MNEESKPMEVNVQTVTRQDILNLCKQHGKDGLFKYDLLLLAGIDCSDGVTSMDWEERAYMFEGYIERLRNALDVGIKQLTYLDELFKTEGVDNSVVLKIMKDAIK